ncbi:deaminase [Actinotalea ferrariae CF5-4]|uniref:Deaminase n=1 Tax=Actinotalea ferrariae CF5-4 TaxID=948458 RepID=A0A021VP88_9CELL|nr:dihydrofolate reductase family protein [Actinotalea ferrariae]EYR62971.1 deaminase [Actinotalea ferrariae CF5-4]
MRRLVLQTQTTLDGFMAGPGGEMDWMTFPWTDDVGTYIDGIMAPVDTIVLGRHLAEGFIPHWAAEPADEPKESVDWMNRTPRVVVSRTLTTSPWENATVVDSLDAVRALKEAEGGDLIAYGGGELVRSLLAEGLVDDAHLFLNPTAIGTGMPVFPQGTRTRLRTVGATTFACGITALHLQPARD